MDFWTALCFIALLVAIVVVRGQQQQPRPRGINSMGVCGSKQQPAAANEQPPQRRSDAPESNPQRIGNDYKTLQEVEQGLRRAGLESSDLILAIDFTKSNLWQGERSFGNKSLHTLRPSREGLPVDGEMNPYEQVISTLCDVLLRRLDDDCIVPAYGFGDLQTQNRKVWMLNNEAPCASKEELLSAYADAAANVTLSGPTSFSPIIREAVDVCKSRGKYHILVIIADGLMDDMQETIDAIVYASKYPLSIVMIGVGDGPWSSMETFDDEIPQRDFDNFQFVRAQLHTPHWATREEWHVCYTQLLETIRDPQARAMRFALDALMELPEQYKIIKSRGMLKSQPDAGVGFAHRLRGAHKYRRSFQPGAVAPNQIQLGFSSGEGLIAVGAGASAGPPGGAPNMYR